MASITVDFTPFIESLERDIRSMEQISEALRLIKLPRRYGRVYRAKKQETQMQDLDFDEWFALFERRCRELMYCTPIDTDNARYYYDDDFGPKGAAELYVSDMENDFDQ